VVTTIDTKPENTASADEGVAVKKQRDAREWQPLCELTPPVMAGPCGFEGQCVYVEDLAGRNWTITVDEDGIAWTWCPT
jgi:hypothetical protein